MQNRLSFYFWMKFDLPSGVINSLCYFKMKTTPTMMIKMIVNYSHTKNDSQLIKYLNIVFQH